MSVLLTLLGAEIAEQVTKYVVFRHLTKPRSGATPSFCVAGEIGLPALPKEIQMAAKTSAPVTTSAAELDRVVQALIASRGTKAARPSISAFLADSIADSGKGLSRIGAGFAAATENASLAYEAERLRQTKRTAAAILAAAHAA